MYVIYPERRWEDYLPIVEFSYKNGYEESLRISPFEALYVWSYNTAISWSDPVNRVLIGPYMLAKREQEMQVIKNNLKASVDRKMCYEDHNNMFKEF